MKKIILLIPLIFSGLFVFSQNKVSISLSGKVVNFTNSEKLFGVTLYLVQDDQNIGKSITDEVGNYTISGIMNIEKPVDLLVSKTGFAAKKILFDVKTFKITNDKQNFKQLLEDIKLYENRTGADLSFTNSNYSEKYTWVQSIFVADLNYKSEMDKKVNEEYIKIVNIRLSKKYESLGDVANKDKKYERAISYYDSALVATPKDSLISLKKQNAAATIEKIKLEEQKKIEYQTKKNVADQYFENGNLIEAEKKYNELLKVFPGDAYITSQISKLNTTKAQQEQVKKNQIEVDKLISQANAFKVSKKFDDAIAKYQQAILLLPSQKINFEKEITSIKVIQADKVLEEQIKKDLKTASDLGSLKKFDDAIKIYKSNDQIISKFSNQALIDQYSIETQKGLQKVLEKKNSEDQAFKAQLAKAQENFDKGPEFYSVAESILKAAPMKSRVNDPEVIDLIDKIEQMKFYYAQKKLSYNLVKQNQTKEAIIQLKSTYDLAKKNSKLTASTELNQLKKSIDSLEVKINTKTISLTQTIDSTNLGNKLTAPGELYEGNKVDLYNEFSTKVEDKKNEPIDKMTSLKNDLDYESSFNKKSNASRQEDERNTIQKSKNEIEITGLEKNKENFILQKNLQDTKQENEDQIFKKRNQNTMSEENRNTQIKDWKNKNDSVTYVKSQDNILKYEEDANKIQDVKNNIQINSILIQKQNDSRTENFQDIKNDKQYSEFQKDSTLIVEQESRVKNLQKEKDYVSDINRPANHLKDENGVEFPRNKMTEKVYKVKNKDGYVVAIITRRIVVDMNGYGDVFEQKTNETGQNTFYKNGSPITEYIWSNESNGINIIQN